MKKIIIGIITTLGIISCGMTKQTTYDRIVLSSFVNYQQYEDEGFLITPFEYSSDYEAIGELEILIIPAKLELQGERKVNFESKTAGSTSVYLAQEEISKQEMTDIAVVKAKELGANAIAGYRIEKAYSNNNDAYYIISGFCIQRK